MQGGPFPSQLFSATQTALQEALDQLFVQIAEMAIRPCEPTVQIGEETEVRPNCSGLITLLLELCDVSLDMRAQKTGVQTSDGFEFSE